MSRVPYTNTSKAGHYVGNVFVPAGATRTVDGRLLPPAAPAAEPAAADPLEALAGEPVKELIAALPNLSAEQCDRLLELERAGKNRSTAIQAIELRKLELVDQGSAEGTGGEGDDAAGSADAGDAGGGDDAGAEAGGGE